MTDLIISLGTDKGTRMHAKKVIEGEDWENIFVICDKECRKDFDVCKECNFLIYNPEDIMGKIAQDIFDRLKGKIKGFEVGVNLISGNGKANMAILSALLKSGLAIRLVALTKQGIKEL